MINLPEGDYHQSNNSTSRNKLLNYISGLRYSKWKLQLELVLVLVLVKLPLDSPESISGLFYFVLTFRSYSKLTLEKVTTYCADPAFNLLQARNSSQLVSMG